MFCVGRVNTVGCPASPFIRDKLLHVHISPAASQTANMNPLMINVSECVTNQSKTNKVLRVYTSSEQITTKAQTWCWKHVWDIWASEIWQKHELIFLYGGEQACLVSLLCDILTNKQGKMDVIWNVTRLFTVRWLHYPTDKCLINYLQLLLNGTACQWTFAHY